jgi:hypothetical protein
MIHKLVGQSAVCTVSTELYNIISTHLSGDALWTLKVGPTSRRTL